MKVLILKPSSLGDVVQALPVLRLIKRNLPASEIYWWIDSNLASLLEDDADLSGIIRFDRQRWAAPRHWLELWRAFRWMRAQSFDWVIDLQSLARSGTFAWLANGSLTIGLDEPREGARGYYDVAVRRPSLHAHAVDWYLALLSFLGVPVDWNFEWLPARAKVVEAVRQKWPVGNGRWIILQPGARWLNKRWPVDCFAELTRCLAAAEADLRFAILGGQEDRPLGKVIAATAPQRCLDLTGNITLPEMVEWIRLSHLMVTNDTGPMHVAAALAKPVVSLFGPTSPHRTGPYAQIGHCLQLDLPCVPCLKPYCTYVKPLECLRALPPSAVFHAVCRRLALLQSTSRRIDDPKSSSPSSS